MEWLLTTPFCDDDDDMLEKFTQLKATDRREPMASIAVLTSIRTLYLIDQLDQPIFRSC